MIQVLFMILLDVTCVHWEILNLGGGGPSPSMVHESIC